MIDFNKHSNISASEKKYIMSFFVPRKVSKKEIIFEKGTHHNRTVFIKKGCLRYYHTNANGKKFTVYFAVEGWWAGDLASFYQQTPSSYSLSAIEDSEVLLIDLPSLNHLFERIPQLERFFRILVQNGYTMLQKRMTGYIVETAENNYIKLVKTYPHIVQRVPQYQIASYLGITQESLSRVRRHMKV